MDAETLRSEVLEVFAEAQQRVVDGAVAWLAARADRDRLARREWAANRRQLDKITGRRCKKKLLGDAEIRELRRSATSLFRCECGAKAVDTVVSGRIGLRCVDGCRSPWLPEQQAFERCALAVDDSYYAAQRRLLDHASELLGVVRSKYDLGWLAPREFGWRTGYAAADTLAVLVRRGDVERKKIGMFGRRPTYAYRAKLLADPPESLPVDSAQKLAEEVKSCSQCNGPGPSCPRSWCSRWWLGISSAESAA